jgi:uncharacterized protein (DUF2147 family)
MIPILLAAFAAAAPAAPVQADVLGTWMNPRRTIAVRTARCGPGVCGTVIWAAPKAQEDARAAGTPNLIGTQILSGFRSVGGGRWQGQAFVVDIGGTFPGEIVQLSRNQLRIEGCAMGRLMCRSQLWQRSPVPPARR